MKKIILSAAIIFTAAIANAQPPAGDAKVGDTYGEKVNTTAPLDIAQLPAKLETAESYNGTIKAKVLDVCSKKGCWIKLQIDEKTTAFVKMKDYGFFVPTAAIGKYVVLDAEAKIKTTSVKELKHYAEDAKKTQAEIDAITKPEKEIRLLANGITVVQ
jgi:hypothetical protein